MVPYSKKLPKTNIAPARRPKPKRKVIFQLHPTTIFSGAMLVSGRESVFFFLGAYLISHYGWAVWFGRFVLEPFDGFLRFPHWIRNQIWTRRFARSSERLEVTKWRVCIYIYHIDLLIYMIIYVFLDKTRWWSENPCGGLYLLRWKQKRYHPGPHPVNIPSNLIQEWEGGYWIPGIPY